jgi:hypothetical protein
MVCNQRIPKRGPDMSSLHIKLRGLFASELGKIFLIGLSSRLLVFAAAALGAFLFGIGQSNSSFPFINLFSQWDAGWYREIAISGYPAGANPLSGNWAFFPLYPFLMRFFGTPLFGVMPQVQAIYISGFLISNILFFACITLFYKVTQLVFQNSRLSLISTVFFAFWPGALFYSAVYSESLFMMFALAAFYFLEKESMGKSTVLAVLAALTRSNGFMILIPFAYAGLQREKIKTAIIQSVCIVLPYVFFNVYGYVLTGLFPVREIVFSQIWGTQKAAPILLSASTVAGYAMLYIVEGVLIAVPFIWFAIKDKPKIRSFVLGLSQRKDFKYWAFAVFILIMLIFYSDPKNLHRYVLPMLPLYWVFALIWTKNSRNGKILLAISTAILVIGAALFASGGYYI